MEPKAEAQLHSWQCKADLYADDGKNALLYSPALVLSALLFNEWAFWFKGWDPIISLLLGITPTCTFKKKNRKESLFKFTPSACKSACRLAFNMQILAMRVELV